MLLASDNMYMIETISWDVTRSATEKSFEHEFVNFSQRHICTYSYG